MNRELEISLTRSTRSHRIRINLVVASLVRDIFGSVTMDQLLSDKSERLLTGDLPIPELVAVAAWYFWWQRRQLTKFEVVQPHWRMEISNKALAINFLRATIQSWNGERRNIDGRNQHM